MKRRYLFLALATLLFVLYTVLFNHRADVVGEADLLPYDPRGFTDANTLTDTDRLVAENAQFALYLDETTSYFHVLDKRNGTIWRSNPDREDPWRTDPTNAITKAAIEKQKATLEISYFNDKGSSKSVNNYAMSIHHPGSVLNEEGLRTFSIKYIEDGFQVHYVIEDLEVDYLYFPKYLKPEVLDGLDNADELKLFAYTKFVDELGAWEIVQYESMKDLAKDILYEVFYGENGLGYTRERAIEENIEYGYTETYEKIRFEVAVQVSLQEDGITTSVLHDSIVEPSNVKLGSIAPYPMFGTAISTIDDEPSEGYIVLPDGSGAVMYFNNGKSYQRPYVKRLYGNDLGVLPYKMPEVQQPITLPLYGMVKQDEGAFVAILTAGDAMASIHADVSGRIDSYNRVHPSFKLREVESITLGTGFNQYGIDLWTEERVRSDFTVEYTFLTGEDASYVGMADVYRAHLIEAGFDASDTTDQTMLTAEFLGAFDQRQFLLGVPYYRNQAMTTYDEAIVILDALSDLGITNVQVQYTGMMNGGLSTSMSDEVSLERSVGNRRDLAAFQAYLAERDIPFYPTVRLMVASDFDKMFDRFRYTASRIDGSHAILFDYHLPSKLPNSETPFEVTKEDYVLSPWYYQGMFDDFQEDLDHDRVAFDLLGGHLGGDYDEKNLLYKEDAKRIQSDLLANAGVSLLLQNPFGFAIPHAETITNLATETTLFALLDHAIPLVQLVLSGHVDYATASLNLSNERSQEYNFLKILETGSNVKYTLSYEDSRLLKETEYNQYLSTQYTNWTEEMARTVRLLDDIGIHQGRLIHHEVLQNNVVRVTYSHGLTIVLNYNLSPVTIGTDTIDAMDYLIVEVD